MRTLVFVPVLLTLSACGVAEGEAFFDKVNATGNGDDGSTTDADSSGWPGPISTVTTNGGATSGSTDDDGATSGGTDDGGATSEALPPDDPQGPPQIVGDPLFAPNPIELPGLVKLTVHTEDADAVRLDFTGVDVPGPIDLIAGDLPGTFVAELPAYTGLVNGHHGVKLTPSRAGDDGAAVAASYEIKLANAGTSGFWEAGDLIGPGEVAAIGRLSGGDLIELGTRNTSECYLRRRAPNGSWGASDVVTLLPGIECQAVDMKIAGDQIFALVRRQTNAGLVWWLAELAWGEEPKSRGLGSKGEEVHALAERGGVVAVCGTAPTQEADGVDVMIQIFPPGMTGDRDVVDYHPTADDHKFAETATDCVFAGEPGDESLVVVGDAFGRHGKDSTPRSRRFVLTHPIGGGMEPEWVVPEDFSPQSFATAVDIADDEIAVVGYVCGDEPCAPQGRLWAKGLTLPLGDAPAPYLAPSDVLWHPAGFAVVASAGDAGDDLWAFSVRAFWTDGGDPSVPAWTFTQKNPPQLHLARSLYVSPDGEIWAGGWGASGYPAVANIHP